MNELLQTIMQMLDAEISSKEIKKFIDYRIKEAQTNPAKAPSAEIPGKRKTIDALSKQGLTPLEIAAKTGINIKTVYKYRSEKPDPLDIGKIKALEKAKWTPEDIAADMKLTVEEVKEVLSGKHI